MSQWACIYKGVADRLILWKEGKVRTSGAPLKYSSFPNIEGECSVMWLASDEAAEESESLSWEAPMWGSSTLFATIMRHYHETSYANEVFMTPTTTKKLKICMQEETLNR